jgi:hypothetical protein
LTGAECVIAAPVVVGRSAAPDAGPALPAMIARLSDSATAFDLVLITAPFEGL